MTVLKMQHWQRGMFYDETAIPWILPSPNMPTLETAIVYPGMCLLEGTNISEGRGTTQPFLVCGAPFIKADEFSAKLNSLQITGITVKSFYFKPQFNKYSQQLLPGISLHVTNRKTFKPFYFGIAILHTLYNMYPEFSFLHDVYEFNSEFPAVDLLCGSARIREEIIAGKSLAEIESGYIAEQNSYKKNIQSYYIY